MVGSKQSVEAVLTAGTPQGELTVSLSHELVHLLSEQLYHSPLKAIEELVVNSYDADADECRIFVPFPSDTEHRFILVYDDGQGMTYEGLANLWHIGRSNKRDDEIKLRAKRKQIGKFGIGKLATYTIANELTYITRISNDILTVSIDFEQFTASSTGSGKKIELPVYKITDWDSLAKNDDFQVMCKEAAIDISKLFRLETERKTAKTVSWTIALLRNLKPKAQKITAAKLRWVLSTAMPRSSDFHLFLNGKPIESSKESYSAVVEFNVGELPKERLDSIKSSSGEDWIPSGSALVSTSFPSGIQGKVIVTERSLFAGKSADLGRSHGFFVRVLGRLVNEEDPLFGLAPRSYQTFNRFRADIRADDLDSAITAPREGLEESTLKTKFKTLLYEIFNEARQRYLSYEAALEDENHRKKEEQRNFVNPRLVEHPVGDALAIGTMDDVGAEADETWFYVETDTGVDINALIQKLYEDPSPRGKYSYKYASQGKTQRLVRFNPATLVFTLNEDHELVRANMDDARARSLLEDVVTAEALLEVYLREQHIPAHAIGEVLERRDALMRSLSLDHPYSLELISQSIRDAASDEHDLEIAVISAARALGFVAKHISGSKEPDGVARISQYPGGERKITLEAKSSAKVPSLSAIDFAGLHEHVVNHEADGCLLVAPSYPGSSREEDSSAATRARSLKISCWTIDQLARVVSAAETRHITAQDVLDIVLNKFSPDEVRQAVDRLFEQPAWDQNQLYKAIVDALRQLEGRLRDKPRTVDMVSTLVAGGSQFPNINSTEVEQGIRELASASQGAILLRSGSIILRVSLEEIERRLRGLLGSSGEPRRGSQFRNSDLDEIEST